MACCCNPSTGTTEAGRSSELANLLAPLIGEPQVNERHCLKRRWPQMMIIGVTPGEGRWKLSSGSPHSHTHTRTLTQARLHTHSQLFSCTLEGLCECRGANKKGPSKGLETEKKICDEAFPSLGNWEGHVFFIKNIMSWLFFYEQTGWEWAWELKFCS